MNDTSNDMSREQAEREARRRWGPTGEVRMRGVAQYKSSRGPGRLARYRYVVGNGRLKGACTILGQGNSWREAFEDARPRPAGGAI